MRRALAAIFLIAILSGCATWVVDSEVRTFSRLAAVPADATYRFERLPSQQAREAAQQSLEAMAGAALDKAGLRRDDRGARYSAQVDARVTQAISPRVDPWVGGPGIYGPGPWGPAWRRYPGWDGFGGWGGGVDGGGWYSPAFPGAFNPWYVREVSVVLRELATGQVVYETHARNDGPYNRSADILPVMFDAALQGFPHPPEGERRVDLPILSQKK